MQQQELKYWLSHPEEVNPEQVILLQQLSATYPAFTALQVCLWRIYKHNQHLLLDAQQRKVLALAPEELFLWEEILAISSPLEQVEPALNQEFKINQAVELEESILPENKHVIAHEIAEPQVIETEETINPELEQVITQVVAEPQAIELKEVNQPEPEQVITHEIAEPIIIEPEEPIHREDEPVITQEAAEPQSIEIEEVNQPEPKQVIGNEVTDFPSVEAEEENQTEVEVEEVRVELQTPPSVAPNEVVVAQEISEEAQIAEATNDSLPEEPIGNSPEMTFSQWMLWIQERKSQSVAQQTNTEEEEIQETNTAPEKPLISNDPLEKLYQEHMNAEYLKLEETTGSSLQQEALERVKKAESGEKNSFNLQQIAKDSLDENLIPVSETLAKIYESQEEWKRALAVYEKLLLQFPDKTLLFAAKIQELKNKI